MFNRKLIAFSALLILVAAVLLMALGGTTTDAARGGRGGKGGSTTVTYSGSCAATPNPVALGSYVTISGSGAAPDTYVGYTLTSPNGSAGGWVTADANGHFALGYYTFVRGTTTAAFGAVAKCSFNVY